MPYTALNHNGMLAIADIWEANETKPVRGRTVWVSAVPWIEAYGECGVHEGDTCQGRTHWGLEGRLHDHMHFHTTGCVYEEGEPIKPPRKVKGQTRAWKYIAGKWDRFYQD